MIRKDESSLLAQPHSQVCTLVAATLILPELAYAQQNDLADPRTTQKVFAIDYKGFAEARNNNDAAATAAYYTRDAVFVTPDGPIIGREAIQKWYTDLYQFWQPKNLGGKADGNALHVIGTAGNEYWASIYVREGDDWKIRLDAWNESPERVHQSFAPQPAATPSATASPSGQ